MALPRCSIESSSSKATFAKTICSRWYIGLYTQWRVRQSLMELLQKWNILLVFSLLGDFSMCYYKYSSLLLLVQLRSKES